jgi:hypothetical protein
MPDPAEADWPEPKDGEDDDDPLFDSGRDYIDQMDRYKDHQDKPITDGRRIAKRGKPGTPCWKTWIPLDPEWRVTDGDQRPDGSGQLLIENVGGAMQ